MNKKYSIPEDNNSAIASEPVATYIQPATTPVNLTYNIPQKMDVVRFRSMMDSYALDIINAPTKMDSVTNLRNRLVLAAQDAKEGRTKSCEDVHSSLEKKFPWLCE